MKIHRIAIPLRIDFAPFVAIALLLIAFFLWHELQKKQHVLSVLNAQGCMKGMEPPHSTSALQILILDQDSLQLYHSSGNTINWVSHALASKHSHQLRALLFRYRKAASTPGELAILIEPTPESTIGNFVYVLNELKIAGNLPYLIVY